MLYLIEFHWLWLLFALVLGGGIGWASFSRARTRWWGGWVPVGGVLAAVGLGLAVFKGLPGRAGYVLDLGLLLLAAYAVGCFLGALLRQAFTRAPVVIKVPAVAVGGLGVSTEADEEADRLAAARTASAHESAQQVAAQAEAEREAAAAAVALAQAQTHVPAPVETRVDEPAALAPVASLVYPGRKPPVLDGPLGLGKDNLTMIKGIGPKNEAILNRLGIFHFCQIADWSAGEAEWIGHAMAFPGRIEREHWIEQGKVLCAGGETEHARAIRSGKLVPSDEALSAAEGARLKTALSEASHRGRKPPVIAGPAGGTRDDLKMIRGIGTRNERILNDLGIFHFCQIADWITPEAEWIGHAMAFPGRVEREHWIEQAKILCRGGETEHSRAVRAGQAQPSDAALSAGEAARIKAGLVLAALPGARPPALAAPLEGKADDLQSIDGIGPKNEQALHALGIFHFTQIAAWSPAEAEWIGHAMAFPGRIEREDWVSQAQALVEG